MWCAISGLSKGALSDQDSLFVLCSYLIKKQCKTKLKDDAVEHITHFAGLEHISYIQTWFWCLKVGNCQEIFFFFSQSGPKVPARAGGGPERKPAGQGKVPGGPKPADTEPEPANTGTVAHSGYLIPFREVWMAITAKCKVSAGKTREGVEYVQLMLLYLKNHLVRKIH